MTPSRPPSSPARCDGHPVAAVGVVADEDEGGLEVDGAVVAVDAHAQGRKAPEGTQRRAHHGAPLAGGPPVLQLLAQRDGERIGADRRVVDEDAPVDLRDIDAARHAVAHEPRPLERIRRDAEIAREVVERAGRQHEHRRGGAGECGRNGVDGAVTAERGHDVALLGRPRGLLCEIVPREARTTSAPASRSARSTAAVGRPRGRRPGCRSARRASAVPRGIVTVATVPEPGALSS